MPADTDQTRRILVALIADRGTVDALLSGARLPGAGLAGGDLSVEFAPAQATATVPGGAPAPVRLPPFAQLLRRGNALLTAAQALQDIRLASERAQVEAAIRRFALDRTAVIDVLAARAYVWSRNLAGLAYWRVPFSGPVNERVATAIMRHEQGNPGTLGLMTRGDARARAAIDAVVASAIAGTPLAGPVALERRRSRVADPELSTISTTARAILRISGNQSWIAHHLIPFAVVRDLPDDMQRAMATAGWQMDSAENLVALPRNVET